MAKMNCLEPWWCFDIDINRSCTNNNDSKLGSPVDGCMIQRLTVTVLGGGGCQQRSSICHKAGQADIQMIIP